ncbi:MAG: hypothetical protein H6577_27235 [Lewinellaceae bacterium]|nr:fatty-acid oxidation protein subunit alpha [Saprospiraceae bacterium]MCB9341838.1 hypothetical protein [Lewinellaceae bacterium]
MAKDKYHDLVRDALIQDGWTITHESALFKFGNKKAQFDLGAEKLIAAEKGKERIMVEVKSFLSNSAFYELHEAVGQFTNYRRVLQLLKMDYEMILALPEDVFEILFNDEFGQLTIEQEKLKFLLFRPIEKEISKWIK